MCVSRNNLEQLPNTADNVQKTRYSPDLDLSYPLRRADASMYDKMEFSSTTFALWKPMWTCLWTLGKQKSFQSENWGTFTERQIGNIAVHSCSLSIKHVNSLDILLPGRKGIQPLYMEVRCHTGEVH